ncbi:hypothetical protein [Thermus phage P23-45]|uniref:Integrase n=1 Tax=Thermus virus P23-45 TaxID=2914006 RepID=A7XX23_BP234|nr:integrase [Thermus phage P23-45]ABU96838.1 XerD-like integrase [Thermus phage P23-45]UYB98469.1 hypothetical protein [Thermus phage P23-45]
MGYRFESCAAHHCLFKPILPFSSPALGVGLLGWSYREGEAMTIEQALKEFLKEKRLEGKREKTLRWYESTVRYLLKEHLNKPLDALTRNLVVEVLDKPVAPATLANYDRALRGFVNWLIGVEYLEHNPFKGRKRPKEEFYLKDVLTLDEIKALFKAAMRDPRYRYRNASILALALGSGLRAAEICRLQVADILWDEMAVRVHGKTGHGVVPVTRETLRYLRLYLDRERKATSPYLFVHRNRPLTSEVLSHWIKRQAKVAGINKKVGMHLLRHTFATNYLKSGGDPFTLQRILRHKSPAMTSRYLHFLTADLRERLEPIDLVSLARKR